MKELIKNYEDALQAIYDHVGFVEDWVVYPIDDKTEMFWDISDGHVNYAESKNLVGSDDAYLDEIYTQRFYSKHVYEGAEFTMIFCNPGVDGMKWFRLFDNKKRV